jgi:SAM-dependent methyltransferase
MKKIIQAIIPFWLGAKLRGAWQKFFGWFYKGNNYYCPLCQHSFRKMLPAGIKNEIFEKYHIIGGGYRLNALCPRCYSTDRDRLVFSYLKDFTHFLENQNKLLHIAPEGALRAYLSNSLKINYISGFKDADAFKGYYYQQHERHLDITHLPFENESFDVIICNHVLEHVSEDKTGMKELYRVLKQGGFAILQVPYAPELKHTIEDPSIQDPKLRLRKFGQKDHVRIYGQDYINRLQESGFSVELIYLYQKNPTYYDKIAINAEEPLFIARK